MSIRTCSVLLRGRYASALHVTDNLIFSSYNIRREKGLVRDPKTGEVGPNRSAQVRYTELADEMVVKFGRMGQKSMKVSKRDL